MKKDKNVNKINYETFFNSLKNQILETNIQKILENTEYNIEEKMFLNRIAFYTFKKYGLKSKFKNFGKYINVLQVRFFVIFFYFYREGHSIKNCTCL